MKNIKRILSLFLICFVLLGLTGCQKNEQEQKQLANSFITEIAKVDNEMKNCVAASNSAFNDFNNGKCTSVQAYGRLKAVGSTLNGLKAEVNKMKVDEGMPEDTRKNMNALKKSYATICDYLLTAIEASMKYFDNKNLSVKEKYDISEAIGKADIEYTFAQQGVKTLVNKYGLTLPKTYNDKNIYAKMK